MIMVVTKKVKDEWFSIRMPSELTAAVRKLAANEDRTQASMIRELLREAISARNEPEPAGVREG